MFQEVNKAGEGVMVVLHLYKQVPTEPGLKDLEKSLQPINVTRTFKKTSHTT